jgi:hypothetical protein
LPPPQPNNTILTTDQFIVFPTFDEHIFNLKRNISKYAPSIVKSCVLINNVPYVIVANNTETNNVYVIVLDEYIKTLSHSLDYPFTVCYACVNKIYIYPIYGLH